MSLTWYECVWKQIYNFAVVWDRYYNYLATYYFDTNDVQSCCPKIRVWGIFLMNAEEHFIAFLWLHNAQYTQV